MDAEWPEAGSVPVRREGASAVELDENVAVYDDVGQLLILLNSSARVGVEAVRRLHHRGRDRARRSARRIPTRRR